MPAQTKRQQRFAGAVLGRRRAGNPRPSDPKPGSFKTKDLRKFAGSVRRRGNR